MSDDLSSLAWAATFDALDVGIVILDQQTRVVGWNDWMARATGQARRAVLNASLYDLFPGLCETRLPNVVQDALTSGSSSILSHSLNTLFRLHSSNGEELLYDLLVRPLVVGDRTFCLLQINDVSVAVRRERVLRERQNARYRAIVDSAPDAIITVDLDQTIQWSNDAVARVFGYTPEELLNHEIGLLLEAGHASAATFLAGDSHDASRTVHVVGRRKDGSVAQFDVSIGRWQADGHDFMTTVWRDVTERMTAEAALRESQARLSALLEALPQLVWTCDATGRCDYFNSQWLAHTGAALADHLGAGWLTAVHDNDRATLTTRWQASLATAVVFDIDTRLRSAQNTYHWFKMRAVPLRSADGMITKWLGTATDITDHIEAREVMRRANEDLEALVAERTRERELALVQLHEVQKMETIGQLTGGVAHDFNNLLAVILGSLRLLKKRLPDDETIARLVESAIQGAERGASLTNRLLTFARRQELKLEAIELQQLIPDMKDFLRQSVGPGIAIEIDIPRDVQAVKIDANQLELALMNLAVNARDAMPQGGKIRISCRNETIIEPSGFANPLSRGDYVAISVTDNGSGMSQETLARATEPFFTTKGVGKGTGLGLSMVHGLTAQAGGAMKIVTALGEGTTVTLWLPQARLEDVRRPTSAGEPHEPERRRRSLYILLVDDDALVSRNTAHMLMDLGHRVREASSGAQALHVLEQDRAFDVLITDYAMPGMSGFELARQVKRMLPELPIILATGYAELPAYAVNELLRLSKPFTQEQLVDAVEEALKRPDALADAG